MRAHAKDGHVGEGHAQKRAVEARVVERGEAAAHHEEEEARRGVDRHQVARHEEDGEHVIVLAQQVSVCQLVVFRGLYSQSYSIGCHVGLSVPARLML